MKRLYFPLILFLLLVLEGVALELLPTKLVISELLIVPHWVFVFLLFLAVLYDKETTYFSVLHGMIFGLLIDIVYTGVLGVYMFSYPVAIYIIHGLKKMFHTNIYVTIFLGIIGLALTDISINIIYTVVGITNMPWKTYSIYRLIPTVLANLIFLIILYPIVKKWLMRWRNEQLTD